MTGAPVPVRVLCARTIANVSPGLSRALSLDPGQNSIALLATDCDDVTYLALDEATKAANVSVVYGRSLYAGAGNAPTPLTGEVVGILAGPTPADVRSGLAAALAFLQDGPRFREAENGVVYLAHCAARTGTYLSRAAHIPAAAAGLSHRAARPGPAGAGRCPEGRRRGACGILCPAHRNELCRSPAHRYPLGLPCRLHRLCRGSVRGGGPAAGSRRNKEE